MRDHLSHDPGPAPAFFTTPVGEIMNKGGFTQRLIAVAEALVGHPDGASPTPTGGMESIVMRSLSAGDAFKMHRECKP